MLSPLDTAFINSFLVDTIVYSPLMSFTYTLIAKSVSPPGWVYSKSHGLPNLSTNSKAVYPSLLFA